MAAKVTHMLLQVRAAGLWVYGLEAPRHGSTLTFGCCNNMQAFSLEGRHLNED